MKQRSRELFTWAIIALIVFALGCFVLASCVSAKQAPATAEQTRSGLVAPVTEPALPTPRCSDPEHDAGADLDWPALEQHAQPEAGQAPGGAVLAGQPSPALYSLRGSYIGAIAFALLALLVYSIGMLWRTGAKRATGSRPW